MQIEETVLLHKYVWVYTVLSAYDHVYSTMVLDCEEGKDKSFHKK